ncbi:MAG: RodZ domain-containing protein [Pseudomonadota bacterium]
MIGRREPPSDAERPGEPRSFDDFDLRIGDVMRGERATLGKSLLDVQRELKIKATYIAAIENADISAFETTGFIAGYVRSYARYLGLDPEWTFETFCEESGFTPVTGMEKVFPNGAGGKGRIKGPVFRRAPEGRVGGERDPIAQPRVSYLPAQRSPLSSLEPRAIGSILVLLLLITGIGYGGWSVLKEVQRVTVAPVERAPNAVAQIDPLEGVTFEGDDEAPEFAGISAATPDALAELYRPQTLETPVMIARDGPIASINPEEIGALASSGVPGGGVAPISPSGLYAPPAGTPSAPEAAFTSATTAPGFGSDPGSGSDLGPETELAFAEPGATPRVTEDIPEVMLIAVREAWVRVRAGDGSVLLERIMQPGDSWIVPTADDAPTLRTGAAGAVFFTVNGQTFGPAGPDGAVVDQIALSSQDLTQEFARVDTTEDAVAREAVAFAEAALTAQGEPAETSDAPIAE